MQESIRDLAESTGGFLIGDSNDLRVPLRHVNEEISSYYEVSFNPGIQNYDGSFRKLAVNANRKDLVIHARNGYFALPPEARATGMQPFEVPLLQILSDGKLSDDVKFRAGGILLQPKAQGTGLLVLVEVPLHELQPRADAAKHSFNVHFSLVALVKDSKGDVVEKLARDRSILVTPEQLKAGNFLDKMMVTLPAGKYTLESAVMDRQSSKIGMQRSEFTVAAKGNGVGISSLTPMRSYTPNAKGLDPGDPLQFQGGSITPTMDLTVKKVPDAVLRLFFTVYQDSSIAAKPSVEIEFRQGAKEPHQSPDATAGCRCRGPDSVSHDRSRRFHPARKLRNPRRRQTGRFDGGNLYHGAHRAITVEFSIALTRDPAALTRCSEPVNGLDHRLSRACILPSISLGDNIHAFSRRLCAGKT